MVHSITNIFRKLIAISGIAITAFFVFSVAVEAATLSVSPATGTFSTGQIFVVNVNVGSSDQAMNAVQGKLSFPKDTIEVVSISKTNSIITLWVQEPSFSNSAGTISFEGVVFNPGYRGASGKVISVTFRAKTANGASLTFSESSVLANDGAGTNILTGTTNGRYTINPRKVEPVKQASTTPVVVDEEKINVPTITQFTEVINEGDSFRVQGETYPNSIVQIEISNDEGLVVENFVKSSSLGNFDLMLPRKLPPGAYTFTLHVTNFENKTSKKTEPVTFLVNESKSFIRIGSFEATLFTFILLIVIVVMGIIIGVLYNHHRNVVLKRKMMLHTKHLRHAIHTSLEPMKVKMEDNVHVLEDAKTKRALTVEESLVLDRDKKNVELIDDFLNKKIADIEKLIDEEK